MHLSDLILFALLLLLLGYTAYWSLRPISIEERVLLDLYRHITVSAWIAQAYAAREVVKDKRTLHPTQEQRSLIRTIGRLAIERLHAKGFIKSVAMRDGTLELVLTDDGEKHAEHLRRSFGWMRMRSIRRESEDAVYGPIADIIYAESLPAT